MERASQISATSWTLFAVAVLVTALVIAKILVYI